MTAKAAVVGWPVEHSLSPVIHGYWLKSHGIDGAYEKIPASPEEFHSTVLRLRDEGYRGINVTVPHKEAAFGFADIPRAAARNAGAANLLVFTKEGLIGADNTDGTGLADSLMQALSPAWLGGKHVVLLGAGGAARGALFALYQHHVGTVTVLNRNPDRARAVVDHIRHQAPDGHFAAGPLDAWAGIAAGADLVINTTSAGMKGNPPLDVNLDLLQNTAVVCDIVYTPLETPLLRSAAGRGLKTVDGLGMLMHQAAPSFEAFFGAKPQVTPELRAALVKALQARG